MEALLDTAAKVRHAAQWTFWTQRLMGQLSWSPVPTCRLSRPAKLGLHGHMPAKASSWAALYSELALALLVGHCSDTSQPLWTNPWQGELEGGSLAMA